MSWNCERIERVEHLDRLRAHYGSAAHVLFPADAQYVWKFGDDEQHGFDMLELGGIEGELWQGTLIFYLGRQTHEAEDPLFDVDLEGEDGPEERDEDRVACPATRCDDEDALDDDLEAEAPDALAPREGSEVWLMETEEVLAVGFIDAAGVMKWRVYCLGRSYVSRGYMWAKHPQRSERIRDLLNNMHPREHVKTDRWDCCRLHNVIGVAQPWPLTLSLGVTPPPSKAGSQFRAWCELGCVHNADKDIQAHTRQALEFRRDDSLGRAIECAALNCRLTHRAYNRAEHTIAACAWCFDSARWYHVQCVEKAPDDAELDYICVPWREGEIAAVPIRRAPYQSAALMKMAARGVRLRADCPISSRERITLAVHELVAQDAEAEEEEAGVVEDDDALCKEVEQRGRPPLWRAITSEEAEGALLLLPDADSPRLLICPECERVM